MPKVPKIILAVTIADSVKLLGNLPCHLANAGWDVHLVSSPGERLEAYAGTPISTHQIVMERGPSLVKDAKALVSWIRLIREIKPDIVSAGTPKASLLALAAAWLMRVPTRIYTLRGLRLETLTGLSRIIQGFAEFTTAALATDIISVSHSLRAKYIKLGLALPEKIRVLGPGSSHGVDLQRFRPISKPRREALRRELGLPKNVPVLGFVGRFSEDKGARLLLATRKYLLSEKIDHAFLLVGYVEDSYGTLEELSKIGREVSLVEDAWDSAPFFSLMDVLLLPTKREGFPNVVLEAALFDVPTVTMNVTGAIDAVLPRKTGIVCDLDSPTDFPISVGALLRNDSLRKSLGSSARTWVSQEFDEAVILGHIERFYSMLLDDQLVLRR